MFQEEFKRLIVSSKMTPKINQNCFRNMPTMHQDLVFLFF